MSKQKFKIDKTSVFSNAFSGIASNVLQNIFLGIFFILLAKAIGINNFSDYVIGNSLYQIVGAFSTMGLANYFIREYVKQKGENDYSVLHFFTTEVLLSFIAFIIIMILSYSLYANELLIVQISCILGINVLFDNLIYSVKALHVANKTQYLILKITLFEAFIKLILVIIFYFLPFEFLQFLFLLVGFRILTLILAFYTLTNSVKNEISKVFKLSIINHPIKFKKIRALIYEGRIFIIIGSVSTIFWRINALLLSKLVDKTEVGYYEIAFKFFSVAQIIPVILLATIYPLMSKYYSDKSTYLSISQKAYLQILTLSVFTTLSAYFIAPYFIKYFFGSQFLGAIKLTQYMFFALIPFSLSLVQAYVLLSSNNEKLDMWLNIMNLFFNTFLSYFLIKHIGSKGSVISITVSFILFYILQSIILMYKKLNLLGSFRNSVFVILFFTIVCITISEYAIFPNIPPMGFFISSILIITIYARFTGILNTNILIKK
ncbi:oligosaccharide flippase family protein [Lutibacter sp.]|uniref:oligosaccharide flippase family protein n=1 Tax=Lutibacter sp. TaxID=1925666 RepID=UPI001A2BA6E3|nr:oligosaccharide flippase family protein [Lutibacter sp.]MBI9041322.1 oligosaccharide flippase family protein [Lutibacter sp.]